MSENIIDTHWGMRSNRQVALMLAKRQVPELVWDAVNLEGINMTLPEIQTLLDGVTVGGHKISDQQIVLNQIAAWDLLFSWVKHDKFELSAEKACLLHAVAAKEEPLTWGEFRYGSVTLTGTDYEPPSAEQLPFLFKEMIRQASEFADIYDKAIFVFLEMARNQFFFDVNKRMGRFMMNGLLLQAGYPVINIPAKRQLEFNQKMLDFYASSNQRPMNTFMRSCLDDRTVQIMKEEPVKRPISGLGFGC